MKIAVVIPNFNGKDHIGDTLKALEDQGVKAEIVVVENGSSDGSYTYLKKSFPGITLLRNKKNLGFDGGVNTGIRYALEKGHDYIAVLNSDAVPDTKWVEELSAYLDSDLETGIVTSKIASRDGTHIDSVGDYYTIWGLAYPTGRGDEDNGQYDVGKYVFGASGGATMFRAKVFKDIGLFDEDFFAYYEDVDISFRTQLAGWKVRYEPGAIVYHATSSTSNKMPSGFMAYQTLKNYPWVFWKNVPLRFFPTIAPRFFVAYWSIVLAALARGQLLTVIKALTISTLKLPKKLTERWKIQHSRKVPLSYIKSILVYDLPPNASRLRKIRKALGVKN